MVIYTSPACSTLSGKDAEGFGVALAHGILVMKRLFKSSKRYPEAMEVTLRIVDLQLDPDALAGAVPQQLLVGFSRHKHAHFSAPCDSWQGGRASFRSSQISFRSTLYHDAVDAYDPKHFRVNVIAPGQEKAVRAAKKGASNAGVLCAFGKLDVAASMDTETVGEERTVQLRALAGSDDATATIRVAVSCRPAGDAAESREDDDEGGDGGDDDDDGGGGGGEGEGEGDGEGDAGEAASTEMEVGGEGGGGSVAPAAAVAPTAVATSGIAFSLGGQAAAASSSSRAPPLSSPPPPPPHTAATGATGSSGTHRGRDEGGRGGANEAREGGLATDDLDSFGHASSAAAVTGRALSPPPAVAASAASSVYVSQLAACGLGAAQRPNGAEALALAGPSEVAAVRGALRALGEAAGELERERASREAALRRREAEMRAAHEADSAVRVAAAVAEATTRVLAEAQRRQEDAVAARDRFWQAQIEVELRQCATTEREASGQLSQERVEGDVAARQTIEQASAALSEARQLIQTWRPAL